MERAGVLLRGRSILEGFEHSVVELLGNSIDRVQHEGNKQFLITA